MDRDSSFWFSDGNIVLAAASERDSQTLFRVHKSILAKHSPVFADMFDVPPVDEQEHYDGIPLVTMAGDKAEDWQRLLTILYTPWHVTRILFEWLVELLLTRLLLTVLSR